MTIQFPANPPLNETFDYDGKTYIWDGEKWTATVITSFDEAYVNIDGDTMTGDLTVPNLISEGDVQTTSLNGGPLAGLRNQLINGDMRVSQRATNFNEGKIYSLDRWKIGDNGGAALNVQQIDTDIPGFPKALRFSATTGNVGVGISQFIELPDGYPNGPFAPGSTWTLSYWCNKNISAVLTVADSSSSEGTNQRPTAGAVETVETYNTFTRYSKTFTFGTTPFETTKTTLRVAFTEAVLPSDFIITGVQLEPGPVATPFEHRPIGLELSLCQRYYQDIGTLFFSTNGNSNPGDGVQWSGPIRPEMRATPTASGTPQNNLNDLAYNVTSKTLRVNCRASDAAATTRVNDLTLDAEL